MTQRDRDRRLVTLWNQGHQVSVIAQRLGFNHGSSVSHAAKRLGLPGRRRTANTNAATEASRIARQTQGEIAMMEHLAHATPSKPVGPIPTKFTCPRCGCRCEWPQGHESWCNEWLQQRYRVGAV
jgi:hypothetical protein